MSCGSSAGLSPPIPAGVHALGLFRGICRAAPGRFESVVVVLEVPRHELLNRLRIRGRADDTPEAIDERLSIYREEMYPILGLFTSQRIPVVHIDGTGNVGQIHDRIFLELQNRELTN